MSNNVETATIEDITLAPSYNLPIILLLTGISLTLWKVIIGVVIILFSIFLLIQSFLIKLTFTPTALEVYRQKTLIRTFPYSEWQNWMIISSSVPVLLYFREIKSIHFLPIIFNSAQLKYCLEKYCPRSN